MSVEQAIMDSVNQLPQGKREQVLRFAESLNNAPADRAEKLRSLVQGATNFFPEVSIGDLAKSQEVGPITDLDKLSGGFPNDENIDEFLRDIYNARR